MTPRRLTLAQFDAEKAGQDMPAEHVATMCPACGTVQSVASLLLAGSIGRNAARLSVGYACEGLLRGAGPAVAGRPAIDGARGCNFMLDFSSRRQRLEVWTAHGQWTPHFELASPADAQALRAAVLARHAA